MAIKIFVALMGIFSLMLIFMSMQDFYSIEIKPYNIDFKNVEANGIAAYELNASQIKTNYQSSQWLRYTDKDVFSDFVVLGFDYNLSSNEMILRNGDILLSGNVWYEDINQTQIEAQELSYNKEKKDLSTKSAFKAFKEGNTLTGNSLNYDLQTRKLNIEGVKVWLELK